MTLPVITLVALLYQRVMSTESAKKFLPVYPTAAATTGSLAMTGKLTSNPVCVHIVTKKTPTAAARTQLA